MNLEKNDDASERPLDLIVRVPCKLCQGSGIEEWYDHGSAQFGTEALEPIRCHRCDGFGYTTEHPNA